MDFAPRTTRAASRTKPDIGRSASMDRRPAGFIGNQAMLRSLRAAPPGVQPKLEIGAVDDPLEREADAVADKVMRMPDPAAAVSEQQVRRKCAACEDEKKLQRKPAHAPQTASGGAPPIVHDALRGQGQPLDAQALAFFEPRFGRDLSGVRIHTHAAAAESARAVSARAYAVGSDVVFGAGQFEPGSAAGQRLIAHELTHVLQQETGALALRRDFTPAPAGPYSPPSPPPPAPCQIDPACSKPIAGSSWDFTHKVAAQQQEEGARQQADPARASAAGTARDAVAVAAFGEKKSPGCSPTSRCASTRPWKLPPGRARPPRRPAVWRPTAKGPGNEPA